MRKVLYYCWHNDKGGKGVTDSFFYLCHGTDLIFIYEHRPEGLVNHSKDLGQIIDGLHIAAEKIGEYIDVQTATRIDQEPTKKKTGGNLVG